MKEPNLTELSGTRCRLQRLSDMKFFAGWIQSTSDRTYRVELTDAKDLAPGQLVHCEATTDGCTVLIPSVVVGVMDKALHLATAGEVRSHATGQEPRYAMRDLKLRLFDEDTEFDAQILDISANGIGFKCAEPLRRFARLKVCLGTLESAVESSGNVMYCRADQATGDYRVGLRIEFPDRLTRARWQQMLPNSANTEAA
jgi:hypothetical protein